MCATVLDPQIRTMTAPLVTAAWYQDSNFRRVEQRPEHSGDRKRPLSMKWGVVTGEHGNRTLRMCWTVARVVPPATVCKAKGKWVEPAVGWESEPTPRP
jgi:hypothetical protein